MKPTTTIRKKLFEKSGKRFSCIQLNLHQVKYSTVQLQFSVEQIWSWHIHTFRSVSMAAFFDFSRKHKHHEWKKVFCDISYWWIRRYSYEIVRAGLPWSNFYSSKCMSLRAFDCLVIELSIAKNLVVKCWQRHIWINSAAKLVFYTSAAAFFGHKTNYKGHCGKQRKTFNHNNLQPPSMIISW